MDQGASIHIGKKDYYDGRPNSFFTPINFAVMGSKDPEVIELMLDRGARINSITLFRAARANPEPAVFRLLVEQSADVNAKDSYLLYTALHYAAEFNPHPAAVRALVELGARIDVRDSVGYAPLHRAIKYNGPAVVEAFLDMGADIEAIEYEDGGTPLHMAIRRQDDAAMVEVLLRKGADINAKDGTGHRPLHRAAFGDVPEMVMLLLDAGADINATNDDGYTPCPHVSDSMPEEIRRRLCE